MNFPAPNRRENAARIRNAATALSTEVEHPDQPNNPDEQSPYIFSFTKGLLHGDNGLLDNPPDFVAFADGTKTPDPQAFQIVPLNTNVRVFYGATQADFDALPCPKDRQSYREWESPTAGHAYVLEGPDPFSLTIPLAPAAGSFEFAAEIAEIYQMALARDWPVLSFMNGDMTNSLKNLDGSALSTATKKSIRQAHKKVKDAATRLSGLGWFKGSFNGRDTPVEEQKERRRFNIPQTTSNIFRGAGEDPWNTPFLSQFMIMGDGGGTRSLKTRATGKISYGAQRIDQKVKFAKPNKDYMTTWRDWLDVQNGLNARPLVGDAQFVNIDDKAQFRIMSSLRDMATYVHEDQLYQAYFNAVLIMLNEKFDFDPGIPYHGQTSNASPRWNREPFALFGGPHLLTLLTEVSSRALKAVRGQKFSVHRRLRPEAVGALFHTIYSGYNPNREAGGTPFSVEGNSTEAVARTWLGRTLATYTFPTGGGAEPSLEAILTDIRLHNASQNQQDPSDLDSADWLMPMAFPEGSPMHPAYGAGHATVASACVTLLKAFFNMRNPNDSKRPAYLVEPGSAALVPGHSSNLHETEVDMLTVDIAKGLTLEGELNKLAWNISNSRNIAGVHFYTDYIESALLGEAITIGVLREQMLCYEPDENVSMTIPLLARRTLPVTLLNGSPIGTHDLVEAVKINRDGHLEPAEATPRL